MFKWIKQKIGIEKISSVPQYKNKHIRVQRIDGVDPWAKSIAEGKCPDCGKETLTRGPCGGGAENIFCKNKGCESVFWYSPPFDTEKVIRRLV